MKYYLVENDLPKFEIDITKINFAGAAKAVSSVDFNIYRADSWIDNTISKKHFIASVYYKWDMCTHWNFYGMDYDVENKEEDINPAYYHICGSFSITDWMRMFAFVRKVMYEVLGDSTNDYSEVDKILDTQLLVGHKIVKEE